MALSRKGTAILEQSDRKSENLSLASLSLVWEQTVISHPVLAGLVDKLSRLPLALPVLLFILFGAIIGGISAGFGQTSIGVLLILFLALGGVLFYVLILAQKRTIVQPIESDLQRLIVDSQHCPAVLTDKEGNLIYANGYYGEAFPGHPSPMHLSKKALEHFDIDHQAIKNGSFLLWRFVEDENLKQTDDEVSSDKIYKYCNALDVGVLILKEDADILDSSDLMANWLGLTREQIKDKALSDLLSDVGEGKATVNANGLDLDVFELPVSGNSKQRVLAFRKQEFSPVKASGALDNADIPDQLFEQAPAGIALIDGTAALRRCNAQFLKLAGLEQQTNMPIEDLFQEQDREAVSKLIKQALSSSSTPSPIEVQFDLAEKHIVQLFVRGLEARRGAVLYLIDMTEQKQLELQFTQAQKMQAVGQLAGGIAHDFNNILTAIIGFCDLLLVRHGAGDASFSDIMQIKQNSNRAANLVRQLLAFSRQQTLRPSVLLVTDVLAELSNLLRRLIGENIELNMVHGRDLGLVRVDQGQLEQVIINLAVNARDAMPGGGRLTISTAKVNAEDVEDLGHGFMPKQDYVSLVVEDNGHGIPKHLLTKVFDPFFTTKDVGKGTGLGLSTVYGIVKQTDGFIFADESKEGGAKFTIYLPVHHASEKDSAVSSQMKPAMEVADLWGHGTILLVEDEAAVRTFAFRALTKKGYEVLEADSGEAALEIAKAYEGDIDLILSDVIMPNMDGPTMVKQIRDIRPDAKIIFISGYAQDNFRDEFATENFNFLPKPFSLSQLAEKVKMVLQED
ncbi:MAG: response regulator [Sphingomonadales bacterium]|jgi:two-component system cell cycle sensor histidine kinase/response regulator CckA